MTETPTFLDGYRLVDGTRLNNALNNPLWSYATIVAKTGATVNTATKITSAIVQISGASGAGVALPQALPGQICIVQNTSLNTLTVFAKGGSTIDGLAGSIGVTISALTSVVFVATGLLQWDSLSFGTTNLPSNIIFPTTNVVIGLNDRYVYADATAGDIAVTIPAATGTGRLLTFKKTDSSINAVNLNAGGGSLIDGVATYALVTQNISVTIHDAIAGTWFVI